MEKPKVRFSYNSEKVVSKAIYKNVNKEMKEQGKIKVKSIVPINLPTKLLKNGKRLLLKDHENTNDVQVITEQTPNEKSNYQHANNRMHFSKPCITIPSTCLSKINDNCTKMDSRQHVISRSEASISETPVNYIHLTEDELDQSIKNDFEIQNCADKLQGVTIVENDKQIPISPSIKKNQHQTICNPNSVIPIEKSVQYINCDSSDIDEDIEVVKIVDNYNKCNFLQRSKNKHKSDNHMCNMALTPQHENKENNDANNDFHKTFNQIKSTKNTEILKDAACSLFNKNMKISAKKPVKMQRKLQVMPCAKFKLVPSVNNNHADKRIKSRVKTRSLFNIAGKASNILVQPETSDVSHNDNLKCNGNKYYTNRDITSKNLLSHPEYNSTVRVMKKLKEIGEEKLIKDVESLPVTYRSLVHGKISGALDFAPYESVYKNLINLSVDDDELPARMTRTKDPEPRNKDIIPSLNKFYNPKITQEHFMSLHPQIFDPISVNTLNAFTISNKICTWRISRDSF